MKPPSERDALDSLSSSLQDGRFESRGRLPNEGSRESDEVISRIVLKGGSKWF